LGEPLERGLIHRRAIGDPLDDRRIRRNGDRGHQSGRRRFGHYRQIKDRRCAPQTRLFLGPFVYSAPQPMHNKHQKENDDRVNQEDRRPAFDISTGHADACLPKKRSTAFLSPVSDLQAPDRVSGLRRRWPGVKIILRADSGFCRWQMLRWCVSPRRLHRRGLAKNERLKALSPKLGQRPERKYRKSCEKAGHRQ
jgi:hypothetical protein